MMDIEQIFRQYKKDRIRRDDLKRMIVASRSEAERAFLMRDLLAVQSRISEVENILVTLPSDDRGVLFYRYQYARSDWEWRAITELYMSRATVYRKLTAARERFMSKWTWREE